jgi:hypothetical protein
MANDMSKFRVFMVSGSYANITSDCETAKGLWFRIQKYGGFSPTGDANETWATAQAVIGVYKGDNGND